jgi:molecular chaperone GrpE
MFEKDDNMTLEPENDPDNVKDSAEAIKKLKEEIKTLRKERDEYLAGWQRAKADFINARKDEEKARSTFVKFANEGLLVEMIPIIESFERAMENKEAWEKIDKNWRSGVEHIAALLKKTLADNGLKEIVPVAGDIYDAPRDEVVEHITVEKEEQNNKIVSVVEKGYELNGKILKPAKVKVGEYKKYVQDLRN